MVEQSIYYGHDAARESFLGAAQRDALHHAWILAGPQGIGKAAFAKWAATALLAPIVRRGSDIAADVLDPKTAQMVDAETHPDFRLLRRGPKDDKAVRHAEEVGVSGLSEEELKRNITIHQVRALRPLFETRASLAHYRVVIIDAIDDMERGAANALLKNLEEPPPDLLMFLVSHAPERLLPTIRSRCQILRFAPLADAEMAAAIRQQHPDLSDRDLAALISVGHGSPGRALRFAEQNLAAPVQIAAEIMAKGDPDNSKRLALAKMLSPAAANSKYRGFLEIAPGLIAVQVPALRGMQGLRGTEIWREASDLAAQAMPKALDSNALLFRLGSLMDEISALSQHR